MGKHTKPYMAYPSVRKLHKRVYLGRFVTQKERDEAVARFRQSYPDARKSA